MPIYYHKHFGRRGENKRKILTFSSYLTRYQKAGLDSMAKHDAVLGFTEIGTLAGMVLNLTLTAEVTQKSYSLSHYLYMVSSGIGSTLRVLHFLLLP